MTEEKKVRISGITTAPGWAWTNEYASHVRAQTASLFKPMGTEAERSERAAIAIAENLYQKKHGAPPAKAARARCRWVTNDAGNRVIKSVAFIGAGTHSEEIEIPSWRGVKIKDDSDKQGGMF